MKALFCRKKKFCRTFGSFGHYFQVTSLIVGPIFKRGLNFGAMVFGRYRQLQSEVNATR
jgi:hypothetical protein